MWNPLRFLRPVTLAGMLWFVPVSAAAQLDLTPDYEHITSRTLDNGLEVIIAEVPALPIVTIEIAVHNGAFTEEPEYNGLSHLYEHMFFKANEVIPSQEEYLARRRELGMAWNGTTGDERVNYFFTLQSANLREGLEFMSAAIQTPLFLQDELEREREVVIGEFDRNEADPAYHLYHARDQLLWFEHPTRKDSLGDRETILSATVEQMQWMQETFYVPNNSALFIVGDVSAEEGYALAEELFGEWEAGPDPFEAYPVPEHPPLPETVAAVVEQPIQISRLMLSWHGPDTRNDVEATYAADVFSFILAQQDTGFYQRLVESGITLGAGMSYSTNRFTGPITLQAAVVPGREEEALTAVVEELSRMLEDDYFSEDQIRTAQTLLAVDDLYTQQATDSLSHTLSYWWAVDDLDYYLNYVNSLGDVTPEDIHRYVETYIMDQPMAVVLMTNPEAIAAGEWTEERLIEAVEGGDQ